MLFLYGKFNITLPNKPSLPSTVLPFRLFWQQFSTQGYLLFFTYVLHNSVDTPFRDLIVIFILESFMFSTQRQEQLWGPSSPLFNGYRGSFPRVKRPRRDADHPLLSSAEVTNEWSYTSAPTVSLHGVDRNNLTATFTFFYLFNQAWTAVAQSV